MAKILIVADDLTGAADCGIAFAGCGTDAIVVLGGPSSPLPDLHWKRTTDVLAIDADTRGLAPGQAAEEVARIVHSLCGPEEGPCVLFKKIDSTLRGNIGVELAAALAAKRARTPSSTPVVLLFAPAFPAQGRTTVDGILRVNGQTLDQVGLYRGASARHGNLDAMFQEAGLSCSLLELAGIRGGAGGLEVAMRRIANKVDAVICDAETEDDLRAIAQAGMALAPNIVWAGSAGLARQLAGATGIEGPICPAAQSVKEIQPQGPALFVVGSTASISREQARALSAVPGVASFTFVANAMLSGNPSPDQQALAARIIDRLANCEDVLVQLESADRSVVCQDRGLAHSLGRTLLACAPKVGALFATGGETARAILDAWGVRSMRLVGEVESGVPYSVAECGSHILLVLTKAGGFGTPETLLRCREFLRQPGRMAEKDPASPMEGRKN